MIDIYKKTLCILFLITAPVILLGVKKFEPLVKTSVYILNPKEWGIVEGKINDSIALNNRLQLEAAFNEAVMQGADTFKIGSLDAYFNVVSRTNGRKRFESWKEAITLPANFNLIMDKDTHLRVQPNNKARYALISNGTNDNITITGGNLYGERNEHKYSGKSSDEWGHVLDLVGLENGIIDGVTIKNGNGDGMAVHELNFTFAADHNKTRNLKIINCVFDNNRRNNLAVTGGKNILIENNTFLNAGQDTPTSKGTSPKAAIDVEPYKERSKKSGKLIHYEEAEDIIIRYNIEKNSKWQGFVVATGRDVQIENNTLQSSINFGYADHVIIKNNTIVNPGMGGVGMTLGADGERVFENEVYGNKVKNFEQALSVKGNGHKIHNNDFENFDTALRLYDLKNTTIYENTFISTLKESKGPFIHVTSIKNTTLTGNHFEVSQNPLHIFNLNTSEQNNNKLSLESNTFSGSKAATIGNSNEIILKSNNFNIGIRLMGSNNIAFKENCIKSGSMDGIQIREGNSDIEMVNNKINSDKQCLAIRSTPDNFINTGNTCNK